MISRRDSGSLRPQCANMTFDTNVILPIGATIDCAAKPKAAKSHNDPQMTSTRPRSQLVKRERNKKTEQEEKSKLVHNKFALSTAPRSLRRYKPKASLLTAVVWYMTSVDHFQASHSSWKSISKENVRYESMSKILEFIPLDWSTIKNVTCLESDFHFPSCDGATPSHLTRFCSVVLFLSLPECWPQSLIQLIQLPIALPRHTRDSSSGVERPVKSINRVNFAKQLIEQVTTRDTLYVCVSILCIWRRCSFRESV